MKLREYQIKLSDKAIKILKEYNIVALFCEVRVGKTFIALETIKKYGAKNILFITKKKAINGINKDLIFYKQDFNTTIINYESLHKIEGNFDLVVIDESHGSISSFPKPSKSFKQIKKKYSKIPIILLSGTPLIESPSKAYHQFGISDYSPFKEYKNFYKWFYDYGIPKKIYTSYGEANDYSNAKYDEIINSLQHLILTFTQKDAGFTTEITEHVLKVKMKDKTYQLINKLLNDRIIETTKGDILADTGAKLQMCIHELFSGTIKFESGEVVTTDYTKGKFIKEYFKGKKIAIMYCFVQEKELLKKVFGDTITDDLQEFQTTDKNYLGQIVSNREGISLKEADALVFYNIPFSGTSFVQGRDRLSYKGRKENNVYFVCSEGGIEEKILEVVREKKNFTNKIFKKNYEMEF